MDPIGLLLVALGILLNVGAQVTLKISGQGQALDLADPATVLRLVLNPWFLATLVLYGVSVLNWFVVLKRLDLGLAYPLMSLGFVLAYLIGIWLFHEPWSSTRLGGILVIIAGVVLLSWPVRPAAGGGPSLPAQPAAGVGPDSSNGHAP